MLNLIRNKSGFAVFCKLVMAFYTLWYLPQVQADGTLPSKFTNTGSVVNTRHNMTQSTMGAGAIIMNPYRNKYGEICVYCHTPHGANTQVDAPLWNRTINTSTYTTYDTLGTSTLSSTVNQPGASSLACLSCHDGTLSVDSIINMPGSGGYSAAQETAQNDSFLNQWNNASGSDASVHLGLNAVDKAAGCLACHSSSAGIVGSGATDFDAFALGTDLTNDHPVGINMPATGSGTDFNTPAGNRAGIVWFDTDADTHPDTDEIRFYDTGSGPRVECASCHDPHGVSPSGPGGAFNKSFLRISNENSAVCLTCHVK